MRAFILYSLLSIFCFSCVGNESKIATNDTTPERTHTLHTTKTDTNVRNIQVALLLDTSNSMDGLIDQAKAQLWEIVNELSYAKCGHYKIQLQIALYEYGNDNLTASEGYVRQVLPFSDDLDEISKQLFALTTNGGEEYCGKVINTAIKQLDWKKSKDHLKLIFIAGNEPFTQGPLDYKSVTTDALEKDITVNTIFCGNYDQGITSKWKDGAIRTQGEYSAINSNQATVHISTPYDDTILILNRKLNNTYIHYGNVGASKRAEQAKQDRNAQSYSKANAVSRSVSKSSGFYKNKNWDLVDAAKEEDFEIESIPTAQLPDSLQQKSPHELKAYIAKKSAERKAIQAEIQTLNQKRMAHIKTQQSNGENPLEAALLNAIKKQGMKKAFTWE